MNAPIWSKSLSSGVVLSMLLAPAWASPADAPQCFKLSAAGVGGNVREMLILYAQHPQIVLKVEGLSSASLQSYTDCDAKSVGGLKSCWVVCESAGRVNLGTRQDGTLFAHFHRLAFALVKNHPTILESTDEPDSTEFSGSYLLAPMKDTSECDKALDESLPKDSRVLKPGDISLDVQDVEKWLTKLGYPSADSNSIYTDALAKRVADFQRDQKLGVTGYADFETMTLLGRLARGVGAGGC